ncbi:hypothetical protein PISMIDRAFT_683430 [Pisolithus microcarpus 441]|uniref:Uncharacterized protein n=1 Tax=Pisolithus microcarpus 441 TaxID=765257 RepID=A0A0C9YZ28_9AGAM|nr:hypothetical protein PISMIDRAFT_683430 [Pisolithus microcarpus 441]
MPVDEELIWSDKYLIRFLRLLPVDAYSPSSMFIRSRVPPSSMTSKTSLQLRILVIGGG